MSDCYENDDGSRIESAPPQRLCDKPSPYSHLIGNTSYLFDGSSDRKGLKAHIALLKQELKDSRDKSTSLHSKSQLEAAEADAASLLAAINDHTSICPPIHDMPPEILTLIFSFTIGKRLFIHRVKQGPWLFGKVCSRWRAISRSSPNLWSSLNLYTQDGPVIKDIARIVRRLEAVLHYSQQVPLHVWMSTFLSPELTRTIEPYKSRLFSLELQGGSIDDLTKECCLKTVDFPNLVHLGLYIRRVTATPKTYLDLSKCAPKLTRLTLSFSQNPVLPSAKSLIFPYRQITHLEIRQPSDVVLIRQILPLFTRLISYEDTTPYSFNQQSTQTITLPYLRNIVCRWPSLIPRLLCPSLQNLTLLGYAFTESSGATIKRFLQRSGCKVSVLTVRLSNWSESKPFARDFFVNFSGIRLISLWFENQNDAGDIVSLLKYNTSKPPFLPYLRTLTLDIDKWTTPNDEQPVGCSEMEPERILIDVIQSRRVVSGNRATLGSAYIRFGYGVDLKQEGVKALLSVPRYWP